jgi:hypothetical protein
MKKPKKTNIDWEPFETLVKCTKDKCPSVKTVEETKKCQKDKCKQEFIVVDRIIKKDEDRRKCEDTHCWRQFVNNITLTQEDRDKCMQQFCKFSSNGRHLRKAP